MEKFRRTIITLLALIFLCNLCYSQEKSNYKCLYRFNMLIDTLVNSYAREEIYVVQIGDKISKGYTYQNYYIDSLRSANPTLHRQMFTKAVNDAMDVVRATGDVQHFSNHAFDKGRFSEYVYKDYKDSKIRVTGDVLKLKYLLEEELIPQQWEILEDTTTILGYSCQKATCTYRGRDYQAWFTTEIPISEGPWKFYGLPGLITRLHDTQKHYTFEMIGFQQIKEPITTKLDKETRKMTRNELSKVDFDAMMNSVMSDVGFATPNNKSEKKKRSMQYDPIER